ncbi:MAG: hypothetical protein GX653_05630 [Clostridiales bacterium]|nr:hypothetical protein [Clostridiales bacterium]
MKARLLWLLLLVCAFLLAMGLMVAAEGQEVADLPAYLASAALPGPVMCLPTAAKAETALPGDILPQAQGECPPQPRAEHRPVERPAAIPYRVAAYHAFHLSDEAG